MILLDVEKAFDRVWHQGLIYKMKIQKFPPYLIKIVASFLQNRKFEVFVHDQKSKIKRFKFGLLKGAVISRRYCTTFTQQIFQNTSTVH
jgi:hypothetical protein